MRTWTVVVCGDTYRVQARDTDRARSMAIYMAVRGGRALGKCFTSASVVGIDTVSAALPPGRT